VFFFGPLMVSVFLQMPAIAGQLVGLVLGGLASAALAIIPLRLVRGRVARLAED
jgi:hypothetical protein